VTGRKRPAGGVEGLDTGDEDKLVTGDELLIGKDSVLLAAVLLPVLFPDSMDDRVGWEGLMF